MLISLVEYAKIHGRDPATPGSDGRVLRSAAGTECERTHQAAGRRHGRFCAYQHSRRPQERYREGAPRNRARKQVLLRPVRHDSGTAAAAILDRRLLRED